MHKTKIGFTRLVVGFNKILFEHAQHIGIAAFVGLHRHVIRFDNHKQVIVFVYDFQIFVSHFVYFRLSVIFLLRISFCDFQIGVSLSKCTLKPIRISIFLYFVKVAKAVQPCGRTSPSCVASPISSASISEFSGKASFKMFAITVGCNPVV